MLKNIIIFLLFFCIAVEGTSRFLFIAEPYLLHTFKSRTFSAIQKVTDTGIKGVKYGKWKEIQLNKYGFYDSDDYRMERKTHAVRILCLGDSITFGTLSPSYNWPNFLEQMLINENYDAEVINAAMPGNTFTQLVNLFETEYVKFKPDILIIYKGFRSYMDKSGFEYPIQSSMFERIFSFSTFMKHIFEKIPQDSYQRLQKERKRRGIKNLINKIPESGFDEYAKDLQRLARICRKNSIVLVVSPFVTLANNNNLDLFLDHVYGTLFYYPAISVESYIDGIEKFNEITREVAKQEQLVYVNVSNGLIHNLDFFIDNYHLTPKGSELFAENYFYILSHLKGFAQKYCD